MNISASALTAQRFRMDIISENVANQTTTRTANGGPYRRKTVVFEERTGGEPLFSNYLKNAKSGLLSSSYSEGGVRATHVLEDPSPLKMVYDPTHPDADANGYVSLPNVDIAQEMIDMISATRSYEANITMIGAAKNIAMRALEISSR